MPKSLMLILASKGGPDNLYDKLLLLKRQYVHNYPDQVEAYFYMCDPDLSTDFRIQGDIVYVKTAENYPFLWEKWLLALRAFEDRLSEFDFIIRPNLSTFIVMDRLLRHVAKLPTRRFCSGLKFYGRQPIPFPSGYLFILTTDVAKHTLEHADRIVPNRREGIDDRCVGLILKDMGLDIHGFPYLAIEYPCAYQGTYIQEGLQNEDLFLVRVRHLLNESVLFGVDVEDRAERDLAMHGALMHRFYKTKE